MMKATCCIGSFLSYLLLSYTAVAHGTTKRPHIIIIMADDTGWGDVSFNGSPQIPTPNLDALASDGVILTQHYVQPMCSPSRAALLTGLYPMRTGMQHYVIRNAEPWGLMPKFKIMPQYLKKLGYKTHAVGKWHLGVFRKAYTPPFRGFDTFYGFHAGFADYYNHTTEYLDHVGLDFFYNTSPIRNATGQYSTDLFTERALTIIGNHDKTQPLFLYFSHQAPHGGSFAMPFAAPQESMDKFKYIGEANRTGFAAMLDNLDASVGKVLEALGKYCMLDNTVLLFLSDNGGKPWGFQSNRGCNWPLRGVKETLWEGGLRSSSFVWSPLLEKSPRISRHLIHVTDWLPTLYAAAGGNQGDLGNLDGINVWDHLSRDLPSPRVEVLLNHDSIENTSALRVQEYKVVKGFKWDEPMNQWYPVPGSLGPTMDLNALMERSTAGRVLKRFYASDRLRFKRIWRTLVGENCRNLTEKHSSNEGPFLFNVRRDPCEKQDISRDRPNLFQSLLSKLEGYEKQTVPALNTPADPSSFPENNNGIWYSWRQ